MGRTVKCVKLVVKPKVWIFRRCQVQWVKGFTKMSQGGLAGIGAASNHADQ